MLDLLVSVARPARAHDGSTLSLSRRDPEQVKHAVLAAAVSGHINESSRYEIAVRLNFHLVSCQSNRLSAPYLRAVRLEWLSVYFDDDGQLSVFLRKRCERQPLHTGA